MTLTTPSALVPIDDALAATGLSAETLLERMHSGTVRTYSIGNELRVAVDDLPAGAYK